MKEDISQEKSEQICVNNYMQSCSDEFEQTKFVPCYEFNLISNYNNRIVFHLLSHLVKKKSLL